MEQEISLLDLLAAAVRKGKQIIIFALIVGLLFLGYSYLEAHSAKSEEEESYAMAEKEREMRDLQKTVERSEAGIRAEREYINNSLYMQLNPYNIYQTRINYQLTDLSVPLDGSLGMMENPTAYVMDRIIAQYLLEWNGTDLQDLLDIPEYQNIEDRYLREIVDIGNGDNGNLYINVYATSSVDAKKIASAVEDAILKLKNSVALESFPHNLVRVANIDKVIIDYSVRSSQNEHLDAVDDYVDQLSEAQEKMLELRDNSLIISCLKMLIIGCFLGGICSSLFIMLRSLFYGFAESSKQMSLLTKLNYIGNVASRKEMDFFTRLANGITSEKTWISNEDALNYIAERISLDERGKVLVTTTDDHVDSVKVEALISALQSVRIDAKYLPAFGISADALSFMKDADSILFIVQKSRTKVPDILAAKQLAEQAGKTAIGYVML